MGKLAALIFLVILSLFETSGFAQQEEVRNRQAQDLYDSVMSPFCPGRLLRDCPSAAAGELKDKIALDLASGLLPDAILQDLVNRYGNQVLSAPRSEGIGNLAWWLPLLFLLAGLALILSWLGLHRGSRPEGSSLPLDPDTQKRIDKELE